MKFLPTKILGCYIIELKKISDERGFFARTFCQKTFESIGLYKPMVQTNMAFNPHKGTFRGLHMQLPPNAESKLVRCLRGEIYDLIVDVRPSSPTYLQWEGVHLSESNNNMVLVPEGCAHGYLTLEENTEVSYQVSAEYNPQSEIAFRWDDPAFNILLPMKPVLVSEKDRNQPDFHTLAERLSAAFEKTVEIS